MDHSSIVAPTLEIPDDGSPPSPTLDAPVPESAADDPRAETSPKDQLIIDPEFQFLPPRTAQEKEEFRASLAQQPGGAIIFAWDNKALDGDAYGYCLEHNLPYEVREIKAADREAAKNWIVSNQLSQRNLTPLAFSYFRGWLYLATKKQGQRTDLATSSKNCEKSNNTVKLASNFGVSPRTISNDALLAQQIDALVANGGCEIRNHLLSVECQLTRTNIDDLAKLSAAEQKKAFDRFLKGESYDSVFGPRPSAKSPRPSATSAPGGGQKGKGSRQQPPSTTTPPAPAPTAPPTSAPLPSNGSTVDHKVGVSVSPTTTTETAKGLDGTQGEDSTSNVEVTSELPPQRQPAAESVAHSSTNADAARDGGKSQAKPPTDEMKQSQFDRELDQTDTTGKRLDLESALDATLTMLTRHVEDADSIPNDVTEEKLQTLISKLSQLQKLCHQVEKKYAVFISPPPAAPKLPITEPDPFTDEADPFTDE